MAQSNTPFDKRLKSIVSKRQKLANGSVKVVQSDGLIVERPRRFRLRFPARSVALLVVVALLLKAVFLARLGPDTYDDRITSMAQNDGVSRAAAWLMQGDVVTLFIADILGKLFG